MGKHHRNNSSSRNKETPTQIRYPKPKSDNQKQYLEAIKNNKITICVGPPGTGKTMLATSMAVIGLAEGLYSKIVVTRPLVSAGESTGYLPGDILHKLDPFIKPILDEMSYYWTPYEIQEQLDKEVIDVVPIAFMQGRSFHRSFIIADESQNLTKEQLKLLLTRFGQHSKMVVTGDIEQSYLPRGKTCGLEFYLPCYADIPDVATVQLTKDDIVRESIIKQILERMEFYDTGNGAS